MRKTRLEAFSDGVIAIIITIMVLEIKIPHDGKWESLKELGPIFLSYLMSFAYIGIYWGNHHHLLHTIQRVNAKIIWANMNLLFWLSLTPFATGWMGENHFTEPLPVACYSAVLFISGFSYDLLRRSLVSVQPVDNKFVNALNKQSKKGIFSLLAYGTSIFTAYINTWISVFIIIFVAIIWLIPDKEIERVLEEE